MLEIYLDEKFHLSSEIQVVEVEKVVISPNPLCNLHREFALKINQNHRKWKVFQLPPPVSPSSDGFFRPNKFLAYEKVQL